MDLYFFNVNHLILFIQEDYKIEITFTFNKNTNVTFILFIVPYTVVLQHLAF